MGAVARGASALAALVMLAACDGGDPQNGGSGSTDEAESTARAAATTLPLADEALDDPEVTTVASDLAPSQVVGSTVPEPPTPDPCVLDDVVLWTAQVVPTGDGTTADAVIRIRNDSDEWCEPDIGRSPKLDPRIEPDVWVFPDDEADLIVGDRSPGCEEPKVATLVQLGIGTESTVVPSAGVACDWWLEAFVPLSTPFEACASNDLQTAVTEAAVVIRTAGQPCRLSLSVPDGAVELDDPDRLGPEVTVLRPGDVATLAVLGGRLCDASPTAVDVTVGAETLTVEAVPCSAQWVGAAARPWFGTDVGPGGTRRLDGAESIALSDPFGSG